MKPNTRRFVATLSVAVVALVMSSAVVSADSLPPGEEYVVQPDDWLSKIAGTYYGEVLAFPAIVESTNTKAEDDASFVAISDPDVIEVGQKLWISSTPPTPGALSLIRLKNMAYAGIYGEPVQLEGGVYEGEPFIEGGASRPRVTLFNHAFGHFNRDGITDAAVLLAENSGGSGTFIYVAAVVSQGEEFVNAATVLLGDRANVTSVEVEGGAITLETVTHGPDDPMCCPSVHVTYVLSLQGDRLVEIAPAAAGIYKGAAPSATCCGRDITLFLGSDQSVTLRTDFLNGQPAIEEQGYWAYGDGGTVVATLYSKGDVSYDEPVRIIYELTAGVLTAVDYDENIYGSFGPPDMLDFHALTYGDLELPYDSEAAIRLFEDAGFPGIYKGYLPSASCCGRDITLSLDWEGGAVLITDFMNGEAAIRETGTWEPNDLGGLTVTLLGKEDSVYDQPKVVDFELDSEVLQTAKDEDAFGTDGLMLYHFVAVVGAGM